MFFLTTNSHGALFRRDPEIAGNAGVEVALLGAVRGVVGPYALVRIDFPHTDRPQGVAIDGTRPVAEERLVEAQLRLGTQIVVQAREHDDDLVTGIGGLADEAAVVAGLPRLHVSDDESPAIPRPVSKRVLEQREDRVGRPIERLHGPVRELAFDPLPIALPVSPVPLEPLCQPFRVPFGVVEGGVLADPETEAADEFVRHRVSIDSLLPTRIQRDDAIDDPPPIRVVDTGVVSAFYEKELLGHLDDSLFSRGRHRREPPADHREGPRRDPGSC